MANNFADLFEHSVDAMPDRVAIIQDGQRVTYRELEDRANRLAHQPSSEAAYLCKRYCAQRAVEDERIGRSGRPAQQYGLAE